MKAKNSEQRATDKLHSLIPLDDFKAILGIDDREDAISRYCLITATYSIEQYCRRRLILKQHHERIAYNNILQLDLNEYPVRKILSVHALYHFEQPEFIEPDFYRIVPDEQSFEDIPYMIVLSPAIKRLRSLTAFRVAYKAGYDCGNVPPDLATACMELAAWNMTRYKGRRIGTTGLIRGKGRDGEHLEVAMPENVRGLLESYRRKGI